MKKFISILVKVLSWLVLLFFCYRIYNFYRTASPSEKIGWTLFWVVIFIFVLLMARFPVLERLFNSAYKSSFRFVSWFFIFFIIPNLPYLWLNRSENPLPPWLQAIIFILWGACLVVAIWVLIFEKYRIRVFNWLRDKVGTYSPLVYSFSLMWIGIYFFSSLTYILVQSGALHWTVPADQRLSVDDIGNFYFWHFWDAVPVFKITNTLLWKEPLTYDSSGVGLLLLLFKIIVISPIIGAFVWYWRFIGQEKKEDTTARIPKRVPRTYHRRSRASR